MTQSAGYGAAPAFAEEIAARWRNELQAAPSRQPGSMREMARRFGVSRQTLMRAAALLRAEGLLEYSPRRRLRLAGIAGEPPPAEERLFESLKTRILSGALGAGHPLPKVTYLATREGIAPLAVTHVYRRMEAAELAHKRGRNWFAGRHPESYRDDVSIHTRDPAVIVLLLGRRDDWISLAAARTEAFRRAFATESERREIRLVPAYADPDQAPAGPFLIGMEAILAEVSRLGARYLGALCPSSFRRSPELFLWSGALLNAAKSLRRGVVWFDRYDEGSGGNARRLAAPLAARGVFTRCHFDEAGAHRAALASLAGLGHRRIAYPYLTDVPWKIRRGEALARLAREEFDLDLTLFPNLPGDWRKGLREFPSTLARLRAKAPVPLRRAIALLHDACPDLDRKAKGLDPGMSGLQAFRFLTGGRENLEPHFHGLLPLFFTPFLERMLEGGATAWLAPNDEIARDFYRWAYAFGLSLPRDLSLLSFDNNPGNHPLPLASVDFGFGLLGYRAFHALVGEVPVKRSRAGDVAAEARVVQHGSLGAVPAVDDAQRTRNAARRTSSPWRSSSR